VGEDGRTHHCLDYAGAFRNFFGWRVIVPADPNQTDAAISRAAAKEGNVAVAMGRSKLPVINATDGSALFGEAYTYRYGDLVWAREGSDGCILTMGTTAGAAVEASDMLRTEGLALSVGITASPLELHDDAMTCASQLPWLLTVEDHHARTGLGASVAEWFACNGVGARLEHAGVEGFQSSGPAKDLLARAGLDARGIADTVRRMAARS
jgi:transketolase